MLKKKSAFVSAKNNDCKMNATYLYVYELISDKICSLEIELSSSYTYKFYLNGELVEEKSPALAVSVDEFNAYASTALPELSNASYEIKEATYALKQIILVII